MDLLEQYEQVVGHQEVERLRRLSQRLAGKRIVHVNSTKSGGGVAEILAWMIPLMRSLGIDASWEVISGPSEFYHVTKAFHNGLQGLPVSLKKSDFDLHYEVNRENAQRLNLEADVVFVHVPLNEATRGLIGREGLRAMKPGAVLVNTSRGDVVDEDALVDAVRSGRLAGAALDVVAGEMGEAARGERPQEENGAEHGLGEDRMRCLRSAGALSHAFRPVHHDSGRHVGFAALHQVQESHSSWLHRR